MTLPEKLEMATYHSFPRGSSDEIGIEQLRSMIEVGLLLTPEFLNYDEHYEDGTTATVTLGQKRFCVTDLEPCELAGHSKVFGRFSVEWKYEVSLELGAMPVFYYPAMQKDAPGLNNLTGTMIARLAETSSMLRTLKELLTQVKIADPRLPTVLVQVDKGTESVRLDTETVLHLLNHLDQNYRGFQGLEASAPRSPECGFPDSSSNSCISSLLAACKSSLGDPMFFSDMPR